MVTLNAGDHSFVMKGRVDILGQVQLMEVFMKIGITVIAQIIQFVQSGQEMEYLLLHFQMRQLCVMMGSSQTQFNLTQCPFNQ